MREDEPPENQRIEPVVKLAEFLTYLTKGHDDHIAALDSVYRELEECPDRMDDVLAFLRPSGVTPLFGDRLSMIIGAAFGLAAVGISAGGN